MENGTEMASKIMKINTKFDVEKPGANMGKGSAVNVISCGSTCLHQVFFCHVAEEVIKTIRPKRRNLETRKCEV